ncbi:hypothetical protein B0H67DRAFT_344779 [Lasiosphaeris hirsuta]|uniref:Secreted protein n=1 Tax=Lasiosphaeris hirsuta TaxID=260670 RepID=A0AA40A3J2_9PEZI|nr:hypothetical protein B0H67DRAFT_344779 [Lasiosphaeris hirsuta]
MERSCTVVYFALTILFVGSLPTAIEPLHLFHEPCVGVKFLYCDSRSLESFWLTRCCSAYLMVLASRFQPWSKPAIWNPNSIFSPLLRFEHRMSSVHPLVTETLSAHRSRLGGLTE